MMRRILTLIAIGVLTLILIGYSGRFNQAQAATPAISRSPATGPPGSTVSVSGVDFSANETGITVTYGSNIVASGISATSLGNWSSSFVVPASASGTHSIGASGNSTSAVSVNFTVTPGLTLNRTSGPSGSSVTISGSGFGASETGIAVTYDGTSVASGILANSLGSWSSNFVIPVSAGGAHPIDAFGAISTATSVPDVNFTITPVITINRTSGPPGSAVTISGAGFGANEVGVTVIYDGALVASGILANSLGSWSSSLVIPASASGAHTIDVYGSTSQATSVPDVNFVVTPVITTNRTSGSPGSALTISGAGFSANEAGITVTYDGISVVSDISANSQGSWKVTFNIPVSPSGSHTIAAFGSISTAGIVANLTFTSSSGITTDQASGTYGSTITVSGFGFGANETGITVTYDGKPVASGISANAQGVWKATFIVPASASGTHTISAYGVTTVASSLGGVGLSVTPAIAISPAAGYVGIVVEVRGFGFAANTNLRFTYDNIEIPGEEAASDATGSFTKSITVPKSKAGGHTIKVVDGQNNESKLPFTMENTPPPVPRLLSPKDGARLGLFGDVTTTFKWSSVSDPSGVIYVLQVDTTPDFVQLILEREDLAGTSYTLTKAEALPRGEYYWRVQAIDGASNQGAWSPGLALISGIISPAILVTIIVLGVLIIVWVLYLLAIRPSLRRREPIPVPEAAAPPVVLGQWREVEPEEAPRPRLLPWRRALPEPARARKVLSTEEQARLKVVADFAQSLPLVEPGYDAQWVIEVVRTSMGIELSPQAYEQLLRGELSVRYEPAWTRHPLYQELKDLLEGQPILQELNSLVDTVSRCSSEAVLLLQEIYRDTIAEAKLDSPATGGLGFVSAVYADAISWFRGKYLREPSERDYSIKPVVSPDEPAGKLCLYGEAGTPFTGSLIQATDEKEALRLRNLHLSVRRVYRNSDRARQVVSMMTQLEVQRSRLLTVLSELSSFIGST